ncbi:hydroxymethylpyrimidine pyrophosphatase-like HAD family hydrolase [Bacillus tianshenii]|uniref:Hydroxymethylpyrimidine pyrophosphatase-like HAD family hydrolase n=1 Tax=Sutcliffiella tianshenii TaxID=1463404 RepID=A0ABS2NZ35_9BACI|nr:hypothetical protein [Bacillus tianshenii]MBM7619667.1 hydroxymethylpyrimidine pyrophosphatase-like HAD family hydrolase [Bacillus tianshenii]
MFVKIYQYHIQQDKVKEYFEIQQKASEIYLKYITSQTTYLNSKADPTKWLEISRYENEEEYYKSMKLVNEEAKIQELFKGFQSLLVSDKREIMEEEFMQKQPGS